MNLDAHAAVLVLAMALVTWLLRFLPFLIFRKHTSVGDDRNAGHLLPERGEPHHRALWSAGAPCRRKCGGIAVLEAEFAGQHSFWYGCLYDLDTDRVLMW